MVENGHYLLVPSTGGRRKQKLLFLNCIQRLVKELGEIVQLRTRPVKDIGHVLQLSKTRQKPLLTMLLVVTIILRKEASLFAFTSGNR